MSKLSHYLLKSSLTASIAAVSLFSSSTMSQAAPLHTPINRVEITLRQLPFNAAGWTAKHENNSRLTTRLNQLRFISHAWEFDPETCTPPTDNATFAIARKILHSADIQTFTNRRLEKNFIIALAPDSRDIENILPVALGYLSDCSNITVTNRHATPRNKVTAHGSIEPIAAPNVPGASKVYAYKLSGNAIIPQRGGSISRISDNPADAAQGARQGSGIIYAALIRNVWVLAIEGGTDGNAAEINRVFNKQIELINNAR